MGIRQLSQEEVADLRNNPYIVNATANKLRFTVTFKEEFWARYERGEYRDIRRLLLVSSHRVPPFFFFQHSTIPQCLWNSYRRISAGAGRALSPAASSPDRHVCVRLCRCRRRAGFCFALPPPVSSPALPAGRGVCIIIRSRPASGVSCKKYLAIFSPFFLSAGNAKKAGNLTFCGLDSRPLHVSGNTYFVRV